MNFIKLIVILLLAVSPFKTAMPQKSNVWITSGKSKFITSPGIEANYFFNRYVGVQIGLSTYFQNYNDKQVANVYFDEKFGFYGANVGLSSWVYNKNDLSVGITLGAKACYGPNYYFLHFYDEGMYSIFFNSSTWAIDYGIDMGLYYRKKRFTAIVKYDTAFSRIRLGAGYSFGKLR